MRYLDKLKAGGLPIDWAALLVGWEGVDERGKLISSGEATIYAAEQLDRAPPEDYSKTLDLAAADLDDEDEIRRALRALAGSDPEPRGARPWRLLLLKETLQELSGDPIHDLIRLTDFWSSFGYPNDMPHVVQGAGNRMSPGEYYTEANLKDILRRHLEWAEKEEQALRQSRP
ncbi:MAG TPA: DUF2247 family protein [Armatimonadota bacterium]|nr:DUF2247 family protein [Armatimonadota bacterium]